MSDDDTKPTQAESDDALAQRDATRREFGELRAGVCRELGILHQQPGPRGMTVLRVTSDKEIVAAVA
ncbi:MAG: hypothetical protein ACJ736_03295 [Streptomyces sp.]